MRCGKCKQMDVDVQHVRACYSGGEGAKRTDGAAPEVTGLRGTVHPAATSLSVDDDVDEVPSRRTWSKSSSRGIGPLEYAELYGDHSQPLYGSGMDADGMTPYLRGLEDEYGFEGMLYMWRDGGDED